MSKGKKILEIVILTVLSLVILYVCFLWKYIVPLREDTAGEEATEEVEEEKTENVQ